MADDIDLLVDEWGESNVQAAFWLQKHIKETGIDGIDFMSKARGRLESTKRTTVESKMKAQMDSNY